ncbi:hypothetical protein [Nitrosospira briensis]
MVRESGAAKGYRHAFITDLDRAGITTSIRSLIYRTESS